VIGVHTREFSFEHEIDRVWQATKERGIDYPVAVDNDYEIWSAFDNHYWRRSTSSTGRASSATSTSAKDATSTRSASSSVCLASSASSSPPKESAWRRRRTGTTSGPPRRNLGDGRSQHFASPDGAALDQHRVYELPGRLRLDHWALAGEWTIARENVVLDQAGGSIAFRFHARAAHLVLSPGVREPIPFRVHLDGDAPGPSHGVDVDEDGNGLLRDGQPYQLVREDDAVRER
jgi:Thioredoxin like C-terminal domain